jgi:hypothetical protein
MQKLEDMKSEGAVPTLATDEDILLHDEPLDMHVADLHRPQCAFPAAAADFVQLHASVSSDDSSMSADMQYAGAAAATCQACLMDFEADETSYKFQCCNKAVHIRCAYLCVTSRRIRQFW